jgi:hypothetical protein
VISGERNVSKRWLLDWMVRVLGAMRPIVVFVEVMKAWSNQQRPSTWLASSRSERSADLLQQVIVRINSRASTPSSGESTASLPR